MSFQIPERLVNFRAYADGGTQFLGMTDVELPPFEVMTETISGAGIAGEYASPVLGHFSSQVVKLKWRSVTKEALLLLQPVYHALDIRGSMQMQDPALGQLLTKPIRFECRGATKHYSPGKFESGKAMGSELDLECVSIRLSFDGQLLVEIDKLNMIYRVNGTDFLQKARIDMGGV